MVDVARTHPLLDVLCDDLVPLCDAARVDVNLLQIPDVLARLQVAPVRHGPTSETTIFRTSLAHVHLTPSPGRPDATAQQLRPFLLSPHVRLHRPQVHRDGGSLNPVHNDRAACPRTSASSASG
jgi:hypothetical protein